MPPPPLQPPDWPAKVTARSAGGRSLAVTCYWRHNLRRSSLHWTKRWTGLNLTLRVNDRYPKFWYFVKRPYWWISALGLKWMVWKFGTNWAKSEEVIPQKNRASRGLKSIVVEFDQKVIELFQPWSAYSCSTYSIPPYHRYRTYLYNTILPSPLPSDPLSQPLSYSIPPRAQQPRSPPIMVRMSEACPGQSTNVNWTVRSCGASSCSRAGAATLKLLKPRSMVMPRSCDCGFLSKLAVLATELSAHASDVLPLSMWPSTPTLKLSTLSSIVTTDRWLKSKQLTQS